MEKFDRITSMYIRVVVFVVAFILAFGSGYMIYSPKGTEANNAQGTTAASGQANEASAKDSSAATVAAEGEVFSKNNCISCHAVSSLGVKGGQVGPDLSQAYSNVESKHGVKVEDFLKKPTSAVMSSVISASPLSDEQLKAVVAALKKAAETTP